MTVQTSTDQVRDYLQRISRVPLLTADQEIGLARRIEAGALAEARLGSAPEAAERARLRALVADGRRATEHMLAANLRLVVSLAKRYAGRGLPLLDLVQEGNIGLLRAVRKFDHTLGFKFSTYAVWWIRQSISRALADQARTVRLPVHVVEVVNRVQRAERELRDDLGREPTPAELAAAADLPVEKIEAIRGYARPPVSLHLPLGDGGDGELGDVLPDRGAAPVDHAHGRAELAAGLRAALDTLTEREVGVLGMRFGLGGREPQTLEQVGRAYGLTRERVRQIEKKSIARLGIVARRAGLRELLS
ncbi:sigma-70 family RNA polymerase sigma factor [Longispora urticae]